MFKYILKSPGIGNLVLRKMTENAAVANISIVDDHETVETKRQKLDTDPLTSSTDEVKQKIGKKRKFALCLGYSGQGYFGLQR